MSEKANALVQRMVDAGEWPDPKLLDEILAEGHDAVAPLLEVVRRQPLGWPEEAPLQRALALLAILRAPEAIPALVDVFRHYEDDTRHFVSEALAEFGPQATEPTLAIADDDTLSYHARAEAASTAAQTAGEDPDRRALAAAALRRLLAECLARAPERSGEDDDFDDEGADWDDDLIDTASDLAYELAQLADPQGRDLIKDALDAGILDEEILDEESVEVFYGPEPPPVEPPNPRRLLEEYRQEYREYHRWERQNRRPERKARPLPEITAPSEGPGAFGPPQPLHKSARPGRNDPCWCGSGKKYKKCHLTQDQQADR